VIDFESTNSAKPKILAAWSKDEETRLKSSSGGVFSELARVVLTQGGVVYGVAFAEDFSARHIAVENESDLEKLRGSKYIPSYVGDIYKDIEQKLKAGKVVLFSGTPCQVAAVKKIFGEDERVYTTDLICFGVPSIRVFSHYLQYISKGKDIKNFQFRSKHDGWGRGGINVGFSDGTSYTNLGNVSNDPFMFGFLRCFYQNMPCYDCSFSKIPRVGDITLGDFWGIPENLKDERGVSIVLLNNEKGEAFFRRVESVETVDFTNDKEILDRLKVHQPRLFTGVYPVPPERNFIIREIEEKGFAWVAKKRLREKLSRKILRKLWSLVPKRVRNKLKPFLKKLLKL